MTPLQLMEAHKADFTPNDLLIYQSIRENPAQVTYKTISRLAEDCGVSQPALSRFVKTLGYSRYQDFRSELTAWLALQSEQEAQGTNHLGYFHQLYQLLQEAEKLLTADYMQELARYIGQHRNILASGLAKSFHPAQLFEILMRKKSRAVRAVPYDFLGESADYLEEEDLLVLFSVSGKSQIMREVQYTKGKVLLVTASLEPPALPCIDRTVVLPYVTGDPESSSVSPVLFDVFVELLVSYLPPRQ